MAALTLLINKAVSSAVYFFVIKQLSFWPQDIHVYGFPSVLVVD